MCVPLRWSLIALCGTILCRKREFDELWAANGGNGLGFDPTSMPAPPGHPGLDDLEGDSSDSAGLSVVNRGDSSAQTAASTCQVQISISETET